MSKFLEWLEDELIMAIPAAIYFVAMFNLINFTERLFLRAGGQTSEFISYLTATIGALIVVKVIIIADALPRLNILPSNPRIYSIISKFILYGASSLIIRLLDEFINLYFDIHDVTIAFQHTLTKLSSPLFWAIQMWLFMLLLAYIVMAELIGEIGKQNAVYLIFGKKIRKR